MFNLRSVCTAVVCLLVVTAGETGILARAHSTTLVVTMTNDPDANRINVYDADSHALLQTLPTFGKGGASNNARGIKQYNGTLVAVVNNGSNSVALFRRNGDTLKFDSLVTTTSAPVSVDFGNGHLYVAGTTTVDSFVLHQNSVQSLDGTTELSLAGGALPAVGQTGQVGVVDARQLLVSLKDDPDPGAMDVVALDDGRITDSAPTAVPGPEGSLTPFGFSTYPDGTAVVTLAHSNEDGLFRDGAFKTKIGAGQNASCWTTRAGKYVFVANTGSRTISRLVATGNNIFVDALAAGQVPTGSPADIDADAGVLAVIDHGAGQSHLTLFTYNAFGELTPNGAVINVGVEAANGVAVLAPEADTSN